MILGQSADALSGGSGWVGAGLLGLVLGWLLLRHLPIKDQQMKDFQAVKDLQLKEQAEAARKENAESRREFREALSQILKHCEDESKRIVEAFRSEVARVVSVYQDKDFEKK